VNDLVGQATLGLNPYGASPPDRGIVVAASSQDFVAGTPFYPAIVYLGFHTAIDSSSKPKTQEEPGCRPLADLFFPGRA